jgi:hypothetical protein
MLLLAVIAALCVGLGVDRHAQDAAAASGEPVTAGDDWFPLEPTNANGPSVIGMEDWLEKPAGVRGGVRMVGDRFAFEDGTPVKFWGVNLGGGDCHPPKEQAEYWAERFARYGINCVRFHKNFNALQDEHDSWKFNPEQLDRHDYFVNELRKRGIYYGFSPFYHIRVAPGDRDRIRHYDALVEHNNGNTYAVLDYFQDLQDLRIGTIERLLQHRNPYSGLTYAEDPALAFIEMQNEASIFFWSGGTVRKIAPYMNDLTAHWNQWLHQRYRSHDALVEAWGEQAINVFREEDGAPEDEHLDRHNLYLNVNSNLYVPEHMQELADRGAKRRLMDNALFMHELQNNYYDRFAQRMRERGYLGPLVGSPWRGQGGVGEYYDLMSNARIGVIDRHNYHGGLRGWRPRAEPFGHLSQLGTPGGGLLAMGMHQVLDRPFAFSEWASVFPNEWTAESTAIVAFYGLGLQGWDASYAFATRTKGKGYSTALHRGNLLWNIERPDNLGLYPTYARAIYRGDLDEAAPAVVRHVTERELRDGEIGFGWERIRGGGDHKGYDGPVPHEALANGRVALSFPDAPRPTVLPDRSEIVQPTDHGERVVSSTDQLAWTFNEDAGTGFITVDSPGTQGVLGFADRATHGTHELEHVHVALDNRFATLWVTALDPDASLPEADRVLVSTVARLYNTGMAYSPDGTALLELGDAPILCEPVHATVRFPGRTLQTVRLLDHDGRRTDRHVQPEGDAFTIDGATHQTFYYEVEFAAD